MGYRVIIIAGVVFALLFRFEISANEIPSGLSEQQIRVIAGLGPKPYPGEPLVYNSKGAVQRAPVIFGRFVAYVIGLPPPRPDEPWKNLAEKRFSFFRDLLGYLMQITQWRSNYRTLIGDGSYLFFNTSLAFAIRQPDGALFRGILIENGATKFEDLRWVEYKIWDTGVTESEPCKSAAAKLGSNAKI